MLAGQPAAGHRRRCHQPGPHQTHRALSFGQQPWAPQALAPGPTPTPLTACHCTKAQPAGGPRLPADSEPTHPHPPSSPLWRYNCLGPPCCCCHSLGGIWGSWRGGSCRACCLPWWDGLATQPGRWCAPFSVAVLSHGLMAACVWLGICRAQLCPLLRGQRETEPGLSLQSWPKAWAPAPGTAWSHWNSFRKKRLGQSDRRGH